MTARQGHRYRHKGRDVLAMQSGDTVRVREITPDDVWQQLGEAEWVPAAELVPLPMVYFHGQVPK